MTITSAIVRELIAAGLNGDALVSALERIEAASAATRTPRQERNRRYYESRQEELQSAARERKARLKPSETSETRLKPSETGASPSPPLVPPSSPQTPNQPPYNPPAPSGESETRALVPVRPRARKHSWPEGFEDLFWKGYPNKAAKKAAMRALAKVHASDAVSWDVLMAGVANLISHCNAEFYPHAATWLNGERWNDEFQTGPPARRDDLFGNPGVAHASAYQNRTGPTARPAPRRTGVDAVLAGVARVAAARGLIQPGRDERVEPDAGDPGPIDADWRPADGD